MLIIKSHILYVAMVSLTMLTVQFIFNLTQFLLYSPNPLFQDIRLLLDSSAIYEQPSLYVDLHDVLFETFKISSYNMFWLQFYAVNLGSSVQVLLHLDVRQRCKEM